MKKFLIFLMAISSIASIPAKYCHADISADSTEQEGAGGMSDDSAPIINCKTAEQDIAAYEKQIADTHAKLLKEEEGVVPTSDYDGDGIIDPEKDIEAGKAQQQDLEDQITQIKQVCGLA